jgi:histidinol-phosphate aminotransferase
MASLDCEAELLASCADVAAERVRVRDELISLGFEVAETHANFVWLPLGERTMAFSNHCETERVIIRPFAGDGVRVTVSNPEENTTFLTAAAKFVG